MRGPRLAAVLAALLVLGAMAVPASAAANDSPCRQRIGTTGTLTLPANSWSVGTHSYTATLWWPPADPDDPGVWTTDPVTFTVSADAPLRPDPVFLRLFGLSATPGPFTEMGDTINPAQETVFMVGIFLFPGELPTFKESRRWLAGTSAAFAWDGGPDVPAQMSPINSVCTMAVELPGRVHYMGALRRHYAW